MRSMSLGSNRVRLQKNIYNGNPLQYSCLENPMDGKAWRATVHGSQTVGYDWGTSLSLCFIDYAKAFDSVDHHKLWKILKEMGILDHLTCLLRNLYAGKDATVRSVHGKTDWFQLGKQYVKAVYCHPAYLTSMQSTSWEMLGWKKHKLGSRLQGEISITSDM